MITWCIVLLVLGAFGMLQDANLLPNLGQPYRTTNVLMMMVALGILVRIRHKERTGEREKLQARIAELEGSAGQSREPPAG